jgi:hypothetical protein
VSVVKSNQRDRWKSILAAIFPEWLHVLCLWAVQGNLSRECHFYFCSEAFFTPNINCTVDILRCDNAVDDSKTKTCARLERIFLRKWMEKLVLKSTWLA